MTDLSETLQRKIENKDAKIGIIGMGYVGIPLSLEFANNGFAVLGVWSLLFQLPEPCREH